MFLGICKETPSECYSIPEYSNSLLRSDRITLKGHTRSESGGGALCIGGEGITCKLYFLSSDLNSGIEYICVIYQNQEVKGRFKCSVRASYSVVYHSHTFLWLSFSSPGY